MIHSSAYLVYSIWMHGRFGQTLGKMACNVVVLDISEQPLNMKQAVLRDILSVILLPIGLIMDIPRIIHGVDVYSPTDVTTIQWIITYSTGGCFIIEVLTMLTNRKRRAWHDFIAGSVVVRKMKTVPETTAAAPVTPTRI